ncbi:calmodulin binding protein PICBP-like [Impatiens glandulifera]|uniref:calmodulin binding protein PICBP-like n=1 Tax=Impatiens glandulifera TaxID=253017 RepID=UPI001FB066E2|nr:calmodulin binding protein PICBP-like [Impatiens glandulifera]
MVQRNKPTNLNLFQPSDHHHHLKTVKKMLINPSSPNYLEDSMNRGPSDLNNNKMKKSRSNFSKEVSESGKPPPNYMKSTSSFDAKKDSLKNLRKTTSFKSPRSSTKKNPSVLINRDTCSSTLKDSKFPAFLELNHGSTQLEGTSIFKVCHYTYCSLNGHHHHNPPLPPLNRFISTKRQILKTSCLSPPPESTGGDRPENVDDPDITTDNDPEQSECLERQILEIPSTDNESEQSEDLEMEMDDDVEEEAEVSDEINNLDEILEEFNVEKSIDEMSGNGQLEEEDEVQRIDLDHLDHMKIVKSDEMSGNGQLEEEDEVQTIDLDHLDHLKIVKSDRGLEEIDEEQKGFNPKQPNYLDVENGPETEKVDLKHQELDDKKNSEEWMLDYAIQQAVNKLGSARKKRVGLLVEAFEKVIPIHQFDRSMSSSPVGMNHSRPIIQACI